MFKKKVRLFTIFFALIFFVIACSNQYESASENAQINNMEVMFDREGITEESSHPMQNERKDEAVVPPKSSTTTNRMVIYHANMQVEVKDYHQVENMLQRRAVDLGGYVVSSTIYQDGQEHISGNVVVKIPQSSFQSFLTDVETGSIKVNHRHINGNDVTEEYVDLESRLRSKRTVEKRLLEFLEKAQKTDDLLKISADLANVQVEIEQIIGRMNYLKNNVAYSTITIEMIENIVSVPDIQNNDMLNTWAKAKRMFAESINEILALSSGLLVFIIGRSPILIPSLVIIGFLVAYFKKKKQSVK